MLWRRDSSEKYIAIHVSIYKRPLTSLSGKNLANNGHSSYKCGSLAQSLDTSAARHFFLEGASASERNFA